jgi:hypothetical protein
MLLGANADTKISSPAFKIEAKPFVIAFIPCVVPDVNNTS